VWKVISAVLIILVILVSGEMRVMLIGGSIGLGLIVGLGIASEKIFKRSPYENASGGELAFILIGLALVLIFVFGVLYPALS
jgi:hypothetical protein